MLLCDRTPGCRKLEGHRSPCTVPVAPKPAGTAPDVRTAAQAEAERRVKPSPTPLPGGGSTDVTQRDRDTFIEGAVWGAALVTPTRRQAILEVQDALGCDIDGPEGFMPGCQEHEVDVTEEGLCPSAAVAAQAVLAMLAGSSRGPG